MARLVSESWCNVLGFICLGDDQPVIEEEIEKVSEDWKQRYGAPDTVSIRGETTQKDRSLIMNPHPKVNPKIENSASSLWALTLTFFKIWMSRLDKPAGISLWSDKLPISQPWTQAARDPGVLSGSSLPHLYPQRSRRPDLEARNRGCSCERVLRRLVLRTSRPWLLLGLEGSCRLFKSV